MPGESEGERKHNSGVVVFCTRIILNWILQQNLLWKRKKGNKNKGFFVTTEGSSKIEMGIKGKVCWIQGGFGYICTSQTIWLNSTHCNSKGFRLEH